MFILKKVSLCKIRLFVSIVNLALTLSLNCLGEWLICYSLCEKRSPKEAWTDIMTNMLNNISLVPSGMTSQKDNMESYFLTVWSWHSQHLEVNHDDFTMAFTSADMVILSDIWNVFYFCIFCQKRIPNSMDGSEKRILWP